MNDTTPLGTLLGAYYHEDWDIDGPDIYDALAAYLRDVTDDEARRVADQIDQLLLDIPDDQALEQYLDDIGFGVYLGDDPAAYREWFREVARRARAAATGLS